MGTTRSRWKAKRIAGGCSLIALAMVAAVVALVFLGGPDMDPATKARFDAGEAAYKDGNFADAAQSYEAARQLDPENPDILARLGELALWSNRTDEARGDFEAALHNTPWYQRFWPLTSQLQYRLASTYYRKDDFARATQSFADAAGPIALGPLGELKAFGQQTALFSNRTPYRIDGPSQSRVEFVATDPLPVVQVSVNGGEPVLFFIDTGGAEVILDRALAQRLGAEMAATISAAYAGQKEAQTGLGRIDSLRIGDETIRDLPIYTLDVAESMSPMFNGLKVQGIVGTRLLMHFISTLDYANGALILRRVTPENLKSLDTQAAAEGAKAIPFWLIDMHYIVAQGTVNRQGPMLFLVDTGLAGKGFTAPEPVLKAAGIAVDWTKATDGVGGGGSTKATDIVVDRLTLGTGVNEVVAEGVPGVAMGNSVPILGDQLGFHVGGVISHEFFRHHALTLDFTGMRLIVE